MIAGHNLILIVSKLIIEIDKSKKYMLFSIKIFIRDFSFQPQARFKRLKVLRLTFIFKHFHQKIQP